MGYLLADAKHLIDDQTWKFIPFNGKFTKDVVDIPYWFFTSKYIRRIRFPNKRQDVNLNRLNVNWVKVDVRDNEVYYDMMSACTIIFFNKQKNCYMKIGVACTPLFGLKGGIPFTPDGISDNCLAAAYYDITIEDKMSQVETGWIMDFEQIPDLYKAKNPNRLIQECFCYGISSEQYDIDYHGKHLNGRSYALLCGTWAILLTDELEFDSLVLLQGVVHGITGVPGAVLLVDRFIYTVNPYVLKIMLMSR